jgi:chemotaxis protein methyltransferase CheR
MTDADFTCIQQFLLQRVGIVLTVEKRYLIETRLDPVVRQMQLPNLAALAARLRLREPLVEKAVINAMTTNETLFFRDKQPFDVLKDMILPKLVRARPGKDRLRVWCAACSSGQEPYSLAMLIDEMRPLLRGMAVEIVGTDISEKMIDYAKAGEFSQFEVQRGLPIRMLLKHFTQDGTRWRISPALAQAVTFQTANLLQPFRQLGQFDIVMCRNVMIYFNEATKRDILKRLASVIAPDGYLFLGGAETVLGLSDELSPHQTERSLYVHRASPEAYKLGVSRLRAAG